MVDGVLLLVDASEGPLPQTRFVLRKALEARLPVILVVNKVDRPDARIADVIDEVYQLFLDLDATEEQIEFPIVYCNARAGQASLTEGEPGTDLGPLLDLLLERIPAPDVRHRPPAAGPTSPTSTPRPTSGAWRCAACATAPSAAARPIAWCRADGTIERAQVAELYVTDALDRVEAEEASAGEIIAVAGIAEVTIGETLADPDDPRPLPVITVDEPSLSVTIGVNTSPLAGKEGDKLTARQIRARLDQELVGNVSLRVHDTDRPEVWEVQGRGELQLAILVELMRREGFELTVGQPQVLTREIDGRVHEPVESLAIDVPEDYVGVVTQLLALRKGRLEQMVNHGTGWVRMEYRVPARGLIGFRTEFLTETRGTGLLHHVFDRWEPWAGELRTRPTGALVSDRRGRTAQFALMNLQERGTLFVGPGDEVYEGMIVGENARADDLDVNATREKHLTNIRSSTAEVLVRLVPHRTLSLDQALEFLRETSASRRRPEERAPAQASCSTRPTASRWRGGPAQRRRLSPGAVQPAWQGRAARRSAACSPARRRWRCRPRWATTRGRGRCGGASSRTSTSPRRPGRRSSRCRSWRSRRCRSSAPRRPWCGWGSCARRRCSRSCSPTGSAPAWPARWPARSPRSAWR